MHEIVLDGIKFFIDKHLKDRTNLNVLDVGSLDINGSFREAFVDHQYTGCDMCEGKNVDIVFKNPYSWNEIETNSFDVVVSGNTFEHIEYPWLTIQEIYRVLKHGGLCCIIVPQDCPEHKYPLDCYRYYPDGLKALTRWAGFETIETYRTCNTKWTDCLWVGRKQ